MALIIPQKYHRKLLPETTEVAIKMVKDAFRTSHLPASSVCAA